MCVKYPLKTQLHTEKISEDDIDNDSYYDSYGFLYFESDNKYQ